MRKKVSSSICVQLIASLILAIAFAVFAPAAFAQEESKQAQTTVVGVEGPDPGPDGKDTNKSGSPLPLGGDTKGEIMATLSNPEALLNIAANAIEIAGIASTPFYFIASILCFIRSRRKLGVILIAASIGAALVGLAAPGVINLIVASARDAQLSIETFKLPIVIVGGAIVVLNTLTVILLPGLIALNENHPKKWIIFGLSFVAELVPLCLGWIGLLVWVLWTPKASAQDLNNIPSPTDFSKRWNA